jgi:hypothetical protein
MPRERGKIAGKYYTIQYFLISVLTSIILRIAMVSFIPSTHMLTCDLMEQQFPSDSLALWGFVHKISHSECYTLLSEPFRFYNFLPHYFAHEAYEIILLSVMCVCVRIPTSP